jgi:hypothetical protein
MNNIFGVIELNTIVYAVEDQVDWFFGDKDAECGSSDVSACVRAVIRDLTKAPFEEISDMEISMIRNAVYNKIRELDHA